MRATGPCGSPKSIIPWNDGSGGGSLGGGGGGGGGLTTAGGREAGKRSFAATSMYPLGNTAGCCGSGAGGSTIAGFGGGPGIVPWRALAATHSLCNCIPA